MPQGREGGSGTFGTHKPCTMSWSALWDGVHGEEGLERLGGHITGSFLGPMKRVRCYTGGDRDP